MSEYKPLEIFTKTKLSEEQMANIRVKRKNHMYLYNYSDAVIVPRNDPVIVKCRGLVLDEGGMVLNYPFERFFNPHEKEAPILNWDTGIVLEKLDGSLICAFWNGGDWEVTTRGSFYPNEIAEVDFAEKFKDLFKEFDKLDKTCCYMFEMVSAMNRIVTWYDDEFVALIGIRDLQTHHEYNPDLVAKNAEALGVRSPKMYYVKDLDACKKLFESLRDDEEGFVAIDGNLNRIKVKQDTYLAMAKIKMLKEDDLLDYVRGRIEVDGELLQKDVNVMQRVNEIKAEWESIKNFIDCIFNELNHLETRKEFALAALKFPFNKFLFTMLDGKTTRDMKLSYGELVTWCKELPK